jgi:hypothetical protein
MLLKTFFFISLNFLFFNDSSVINLSTDKSFTSDVLFSSNFFVDDIIYGSVN